MFRRHVSTLSHVVAACLFASLATAQVAVHVVDDDGGAGVSFTDIQSAVAAASEGDIVLVRSGEYGSVSLLGKGLYLFEEEGHEAIIRGSLSIRALPPNRHVGLRGIDVFVPLTFDPVDVSNNAGSVHIEDAEIRNGTLGQFGSLPEAMRVQNSSAVTLVRCSLTGSQAGGSTGGGHALIATSSSLNLFDCTLQGGKGAIGDGHEGGYGAFLSNATLFASGTLFAGANGGNGVTIVTQFGSICRNGGDGGNGLFVKGSAAHATLLDSTATAGVGGNAPSACTGGGPGQPIALSGGSLGSLAGTSRGYRISSTTREGAPATMEFRGEPGDLVLVGISDHPASVFVRGLNGTLLVDPSALRFLAPHVLPASGFVTTTKIAPSVPALAGLAVHTQALFRAVNGERFLGPGSTLVLLDAGL